MTVVLSIVIAIIGGLAVLGIVAYLRRRRLCYVSPRSFDYSDLSEGSKTVELIILNLGRRAELEIKLELSSSFRYTLLAATEGDLRFSGGNVLRVERLPPRSELSLVFVAEGAVQFTESDIVRLTSQDCVGRLSPSVQVGQPSGLAVAAGVSIMFVSAIGLGKIVEHWAWPVIKSSSLMSFLDEPLPQTHNCYSDMLLRSATGENGPLTETEDWIEVVRVWRRLDGVFADVRLTNHLSEIMEVSIFAEPLSSAASEMIEYVWSDPVIDALVPAKNDGTFMVSAYLPKSSLVQSFESKIHVKTLSGILASIRLRIGIGETRVSCPTLSAVDL